MKKFLHAGILGLLFVCAGFAQTNNFWSPVNNNSVAAEKVKRPFYSSENLYRLNLGQLQSSLSNVPARGLGKNGVTISIPSVNGQLEQFKVFEVSNFAPELQAQYPGIRSYAGRGIDDPTAIVRFSISHKGLQSMTLRAGKKTEFIEPYTDDAGVYTVFTSGAKNQKDKVPFTCFTQDEPAAEESHTGGAEQSLNRSGMADNAVFKTFRLALSCTAEYTQYHGGSVADALAAMNATMTRVNGVYERDLAVRLEIIANTTDVIYTNPATDPYSSNGWGGAWSNQLQATLNSEIGSANYDIGHLFGSEGGGGFAGCIGCVCGANKGSGYTSPVDGIPEGDTFDIDYVAHEMGHQLGANHTYSVDNEGTGVNIEPGSGSTIMGYAGITIDYDVQPHSDDYFAYRSILQIQNNLVSKPCAVNTPIDNPAMTINAGPDYIIPKGTAFILKAVDADANNEGVTYNWEQNDNATNAVTGNNSVVYPDKPVGPTFRSVPPSESPNRYMPALQSVLNNTLTANWETVSTVARQLNFTLTGRDNVAGGGQTATDAMKVTVNGVAGPFAVTSQNTEGVSWDQGSEQTITWNVAGTTANGINTQNVNILLSTDGGQTFSTVLAANTPNDGNEVITVPNVQAPFCRIMVEAVDNIYYAVNETPFAIAYTVTTTCNTYTNNTPLVIPDGAGPNSPGNVVASTINVPENATISDVNVTMQIQHTYVNDLVIGLARTDELQPLLWARNCEDEDNNFTITFSDGSPAINCSALDGGTYSPQDELSVFNGLESGGDWILFAADFWNQDAGQITSWSIEICSQTIVAGTNEYGLNGFTLYPNPNNGNFTVEFTSASQNDIQIAVHDMRGRQILNNSYQNTGVFSGNINLDGAQAGVYMVTVQDGSRKEVKRIVIK